MIKEHTYSFIRALRYVVLFTMLACLACSKPDDPQPTPPTPPNPPVNIPTGVIEYFLVDTNLVGFNRATFAKWLVSGGNTLTRVTLSGDLVGLYGPRSTGLLKKDTVFTLAINNGVQATQKITVADSITTMLWNDGKYAQRTKSQVYSGTGYKDTAVTLSMERIFFNLNKNTTVINIGSPSPPDGGPFTVTQGRQANGPSMPYIPPTLTWRNTTFTIISLDTQLLVVTYQAPDSTGTMRSWKDTYTFM